MLVFIDIAIEVVQKRLLAHRANVARADVTDSVMTDHLDAFDAPASGAAHVRIDDAAHISAVVAAVRVALDH